MVKNPQSLNSVFSHTVRTLLLIALLPLKIFGQPRVLKEIGIGISSSPGIPVKLNGTVYFSAASSLGRELWKTDGTEEGTQLVIDLLPGAGSSSPFNLTIFKDQLYFFAQSTAVGYDLVKTNGSEAGTEIVYHFDGTNKLTFFHLTPVANLLYFRADDGIHGSELWKTDGTAEGTTMVKDILPGSKGSYPLDGIVEVNGKIFFNADSDDDLEYELWKSDGTELGTVQVKDINASEGVEANGLFYFLAFNGGVAGLWKSDGTNLGTQLVKGFSANIISKIVKINNRILTVNFTDLLSPGELWISDGTTDGTINHGLVGPDLNGRIFNNQFYFSGLSGEASTLGKPAVWVSDGSLEGTKEFLSTSVFNDFGRFYSDENNLYFNSQKSMWISDGTIDGTKLLFEYNFKAQGAIVTINEKVLFYACDQSNDCELWVFDPNTVEESEEQEPEVVDPVLSIEESVETSFYPNPVIDELHLSNSINIEGAKIIDASGKEVTVEKIARGTYNSVSVRNLPNGQYFLILTSQSNTRKIRFIKQ